MTAAVRETARQAALQAAADMAEALGADITIRQLIAIVDAAAPHLVIEKRPGDLDAAPYHRLIHSLVAAGWTVANIADHTPVSRPDFASILQRPVITARTARRLVEVFAALYGLDPAANGVSQKGITQSLNRARTNGWTVIPLDEADQIIGRATIAA